MGLGFCYNKIKNLWKEQCIFCLPSTICYLFFTQRRRCCCFASPVGCRVDLVWVTLIKTVCSSWTRRTNEDNDTLPSFFLAQWILPFCVTQWIYRAVKVVQFLFSPHTTRMHRFLFPIFTVLYCEAVLAVLESPDTFFCSFVAALLWLQQETHLPSKILSIISISQHRVACLQINRQIIRSFTKREYNSVWENYCGRSADIWLWSVQKIWISERQLSLKACLFLCEDLLN